MNPKGLVQAQGRLNTARKALEEFELAQPGSQEYEDAWAEFILALSSVFSKLEQGAKSSPKSKAWFGLIKNKRRTDPLLQYLHQARNSEFHGLETGITTIPEQTSQMYTVTKVEGLKLTVEPIDRMHIQPRGSALTRVYNTQYGDTFDPPREHLGKPLDDNKPSTVARLGFVYVQGIVKDAVDLDPS